jgi:hypothetical protein
MDLGLERAVEDIRLAPRQGVRLASKTQGPKLALSTIHRHGIDRISVLVRTQLSVLDSAER